MPGSVHQPASPGPLHDLVELAQERVGTHHELGRMVDPATWVQGESLGSPVVGDLGVLCAEQGQREVFHPGNPTTNTRSMPS